MLIALNMCENLIEQYLCTLIVTAMSRSSSSADDCQSSRREIAARAAERRIQANARAIAAAGATTTSGKRRAPVDTSQVQFSDSDDSDQGVTSVGSVKGYHFSGEGSKRGAGGAKKRGRREENASGSMVSFCLLLYCSSCERITTVIYMHVYV